MIRFQLGGQIAANIEAQNHMLFDAMTPEQQQQVLAAQVKRNAVQAVLGRKRCAKFGWIGVFIFLAILITNNTGKAPGFLVLGLIVLAGVGCLVMYERVLRSIVADAEATGLVPKASVGDGQ